MSNEVIVPSNISWLSPKLLILPGDTIVVPIDLDESKIQGLTVLTSISRIIYELAIGAAAIESFRD